VRAVQDLSDECSGGFGERDVFPLVVQLIGGERFFSRWFDGAELVGHWEVRRGAEAEVFEEVAGRAVEVGAAEGVVLARDADEVAFHELLEHLGGGDTSDGFDVGTGDGLAVGDDGERLHCGGGEFEPCLSLVQLVEPGGKLGPREQLVAGRDSFDAEGGPRLVVGDVQLVDECAGFGRVGQHGNERELARGEGRVGDEEGRFESGHFLGATEGVWSAAERVAILSDRREPMEAPLPGLRRWGVGVAGREVR